MTEMKKYTWVHNPKVGHIGYGLRRSKIPRVTTDITDKLYYNVAISREHSTSENFTFYYYELDTDLYNKSEGNIFGFDVKYKVKLRDNEAKGQTIADDINIYLNMTSSINLLLTNDFARAYYSGYFRNGQPANDDTLFDYHLNMIQNAGYVDMFSGNINRAKLEAEFPSIDFGFSTNPSRVNSTLLSISLPPHYSIYDGSDEHRGFEKDHLDYTNATIDRLIYVSDTIKKPDGTEIGINIGDYMGKLDDYFNYIPASSFVSGVKRRNRFWNKPVTEFNQAFGFVFLPVDLSIKELIDLQVYNKTRLKFFICITRPIESPRERKNVPTKEVIFLELEPGLGNTRYTENDQIDIASNDSAISTKGKKIGFTPYDVDLANIRRGFTLVASISLLYSTFPNSLPWDALTYEPHFRRIYCKAANKAYVKPTLKVPIPRTRVTASGRKIYAVIYNPEPRSFPDYYIDNIVLKVIIKKVSEEIKTVYIKPDDLVNDRYDISDICGPLISESNINYVRVGASFTAITGDRSPNHGWSSELSLQERYTIVTPDFNVTKEVQDRAVTFNLTLRNDYDIVGSKIGKRTDYDHTVVRISSRGKTIATHSVHLRNSGDETSIQHQLYKDNTPNNDNQLWYGHDIYIGMYFVSEIDVNSEESGGTIKAITEPDIVIPEPRFDVTYDYHSALVTITPTSEVPFDKLDRLELEFGLDWNTPIERISVKGEQMRSYNAYDLLKDHIGDDWFDFTIKGRYVDKNGHAGNWFASANEMIYGTSLLETPSITASYVTENDTKNIAIITVRLQNNYEVLEDSIKYNNIFKDSYVYVYSNGVLVHTEQTNVLRDNGNHVSFRVPVKDSGSSGNDYIRFGEDITVKMVWRSIDDITSESNVVNLSPIIKPKPNYVIATPRASGSITRSSTNKNLLTVRMENNFTVIPSTNDTEYQFNKTIITITSERFRLRFQGERDANIKAVGETFTYEIPTDDGTTPGEWANGIIYNKPVTMTIQWETNGGHKSAVYGPIDIGVGITVETNSNTEADSGTPWDFEIYDDALLKLNMGKIKNYMISFVTLPNLYNDKFLAKKSGANPYTNGVVENHDDPFPMVGYGTAYSLNRVPNENNALMVYNHNKAAYGITTNGEGDEPWLEFEGNPIFILLGDDRGIPHINIPDFKRKMGYVDEDGYIRMPFKMVRNFDRLTSKKYKLPNRNRFMVIPDILRRSTFENSKEYYIEMLVIHNDHYDVENNNFMTAPRFLKAIYYKLKLDNETLHNSRKTLAGYTVHEHHAIELPLVNDVLEIDRNDIFLYGHRHQNITSYLQSKNLLTPYDTVVKSVPKINGTNKGEPNYWDVDFTIVTQGPLSSSGSLLDSPLDLRDSKIRTNDKYQALNFGVARLVQYDKTTQSNNVVEIIYNNQLDKLENFYNKKSENIPADDTSPRMVLLSFNNAKYTYFTHSKKWATVGLHIGFITLDDGRTLVEMHGGRYVGGLFRDDTQPDTLAHNMIDRSIPLRDFFDDYCLDYEFDINNLFAPGQHTSKIKLRFNYEQILPLAEVYGHKHRFENMQPISPRDHEFGLNPYQVDNIRAQLPMF